MTNLSKGPKNKQFSAVYPDDSRDTTATLNVIIEALLDKKAHDIAVLDISELTTLAEYFVICHGNSDTQIKALSDSVEEKVAEFSKEKVWKREGLKSGGWIILDYVNIVVHIMSAEKREYYGIERMWNDAVITHISDNG